MEKLQDEVMEPRIVENSVTWWKKKILFYHYFNLCNRNVEKVSY